MSERTVLEAIQARRLLSATPQSTVFDAVCRMTKANRGSVLILDQSGKLSGIFTERDLMKRVVSASLDPKTTPLSEVMTPNPKTIPPETRVPDAVFLMRQWGFRHFPIMSSAGDIIGVFSLRDAMPGEIVDAEHLSDHLDEQFADVLA